MSTRLKWIVAIICLAAVTYVITWVVLEDRSAAQGRSLADEEWSAGNFYLFDNSQKHEWRDDLGGYVVHPIDPATGFRRVFYSTRRSSERFYRAFNERMSEFISENGLPAGSMKDHIVDDDFLCKMLESTAFNEFTRFPHDFSPRLFVTRGSISRWGTDMSTPKNNVIIGAAASGWYVHDLARSVPCLWRYSDLYPGIVFIRIGNKRVGAFHVESGTFLGEAWRF